jgi:hypothetical protein
MAPNAMHSQRIDYSIASDAAGNTRTVWVLSPVPYNTEVPNNGLYIGSVDSDGNPSGSEMVEGFSLTQDPNYKVFPEMGVDVTVAPDGSFAITFIEDVLHFPTPGGPADWTSATLYVIHYTSAGVPTGDRIQVDQVVDSNPSDTTTPSIVMPKVGADGQGGLSVAWERTTRTTSLNSPAQQTDTSLLFARIDATGAVGTPQTIATFSGGFTAGNTSYGTMIESHDLATDAAGNSVVVWPKMVATSSVFRFGLQEVDAEKLNPDGTQNGGWITVTQPNQSGGRNSAPQVAVDNNGGFGVSWSRIPVPFPPSGTAPGIYTQKFDASGPVGNPILVVGGPGYHAPPSHIGMDADGNFVIGWSESVPSTGNDRLWAQAYYASTAPWGDRVDLLSGATKADTLANVGPDGVTIAMDAIGNFTAAWGDNSQSAEGGTDVMAQRFIREDHAPPGPPRAAQGFGPTRGRDSVDPGAPAQATGNYLAPVPGDSTGVPVTLAAVPVSANPPASGFAPGGLQDGSTVVAADPAGAAVSGSSGHDDWAFGDGMGIDLNSDPGLDPNLTQNG